MIQKIKRYNINPGNRHVNSKESDDYHNYGGWKLHLTVNPKNYALVDEWLDKNHPGQYKLLHGGDPGEKDFTIYIGRISDVKIMVPKIMREIGHLLDKNNAGSEDILFTDKIAGRFDPRGNKNRFDGDPGFDGSKGIYYGRNGIPYDRRGADIRMQITYALQAKDEKKANEWKELLKLHEEKIKANLLKQYGSRYEIHRKKKISKPMHKTCSCKK
jgi:hypothetical protein